MFTATQASLAPRVDPQWILRIASHNTKGTNPLKGAMRDGSREMEPERSDDQKRDCLSKHSFPGSRGIAALWTLRPPLGSEERRSSS